MRVGAPHSKMGNCVSTKSHANKGLVKCVWWNIMSNHCALYLVQPRTTEIYDYLYMLTIDIGCAYFVYFAIYRRHSHYQPQKLTLQCSIYVNLCAYIYTYMCVYIYKASIGKSTCQHNDNDWEASWCLHGIYVNELRDHSPVRWQDITWNNAGLIDYKEQIWVKFA